MNDGQAVLGKDWHQDIRYPLAYPVTRGQKIACWLLGLMFGGMGGGMLFVATQSHKGATGGIVLIGVGLCLLCVPLYTLVYAGRARVTLEADAIEVQKAFTLRRLARSDIRGHRTLRTRTGRIVVLVPKSGGSVRIESSTFGLDDRFWAWLGSLPNLDDEERTATLEEVSRDASLGANPDERLAKLDQAKRLARVLNIAAMVVVYWGYIYPRPYGLVIAAAAALPWLGVILLWSRPGLFRLDGRPVDAKPNIALMVFVPPPVLVIRALFDLTIVDVWKWLPWGAALGIPLFVALAARPRGGASDGKRTVATVLVLPFAIVYGIGLLALADALWDRAQPDGYPTIVLGKDVSHGKTTTYSLDLGSWRKDIDKNHVDVSRAFYESVQRGDKVCVYLHPGRFDLRWMQVGDCGQTGNR